MISENPAGFQPELLLDMMRTKMPFGKYKDTYLYQLPVSYLEWFGREGFPQGKLGLLLQTVLEIKANGLEYLFEGLKKVAAAQTTTYR